MKKSTKVKLALFGMVESVVLILLAIIATLAVVEGSVPVQALYIAVFFLCVFVVIGTLVVKDIFKKDEEES